MSVNSIGSFGFAPDQQPASAEVAHEGPHPEQPGRRRLRRGHAIDQGAEAGCRDADYIPLLMGKPPAGHVAILSRREQGAEEQREAVGIMMLAEGLANQILG